LPTPENEKKAKIQSISVKCNCKKYEKNISKLFYLLSLGHCFFDTADKHSFAIPPQIFENGPDGILSGAGEIDS
jgi:hypothetical protein